MNIKDYEFSDMYMPKVLSANDIAVCLNTEDLPWVSINKADVIALAKHFDLLEDK
jgi:hypothetical protein